MGLIARAVSHRGEVTLASRPEDVLELRVNGTFVMDTAETTSERLLTQAALDALEQPRRVLIGGLGLGFTTAQVLADPRVTSVDVVEIEEAVIDWMSSGLIPHGRDLLADARVAVHAGDVRAHLAAAPAEAYDVILLDVDNGPDQLVHVANRALYESAGLTVAAHALAPDGVLVVWSAHPAPALAAALQSSIGSLTTHRVPVRLGHRDEEYWLYAAVRQPITPASASPRAGPTAGPPRQPPPR